MTAARRLAPTPRFKKQFRQASPHVRKGAEKAMRLLLSHPEAKGLNFEAGTVVVVRYLG